MAYSYPNKDTCTSYRSIYRVARDGAVRLGTALQAGR